MDHGGKQDQAVAPAVPGDGRDMQGHEQQQNDFASAFVPARSDGNPMRGSPGSQRAGKRNFIVTEEAAACLKT